MSESMTVADAAHEAGVSEKTIRNAITAGDLPARKFGNVWSIDSEDLDEWMDIDDSGEEED